MTPDLEELEFDLVLEAVQRRFGYDFRGYARPSLKRRLRNLVEEAQVPSLSHLLPRLLHEDAYIDHFVNRISVPTTALFRHAQTLDAMREIVFPVLRTYGYAKVWLAGCSTGEEVYSVAILLEEAGLLDRVQIYATDISTRALAVARDGIYRLEALKAAEADYAEAGGTRQLRDYYLASYGSAKFAERLGRRIVFSQHNLVTDAVFGEMHLVLCRNVLIYFGRQLQQHVIRLLHASLVRRGFLLLGAKEMLQHVDGQRHFEPVKAEAHLFRAL